MTVLNLKFYIYKISNFCIIKKMKILLQSFTIFMFLTSFTSSYACEFLKIQNGTPIQNILQQYQDLDDPMSIGTDKGIWEVQYSASNFGKNFSISPVTEYLMLIPSTKYSCF